MTTSFTRTREQLAAMVLRKVGVLGSGATALSADTDIVYEAVDLRLKEMHELGVFWRKVTNVPTTFSVSASVATASAGAGDILFPLKITYTNATNDDQVDIIGPRQYAEIEDKTRAGNPTKALWKGGTEFIFYPVPTANGTCKLLYEKIADDTSAGAAIDVDVSMLRWVKDIIAYDLGDDFGTPEVTMARWGRESEIAMRKIKKLGALHVDFETVKVDSFDDRNPNELRATDYGW